MQRVMVSDELQAYEQASDEGKWLLYKGILERYQLLYRDFKRFTTKEQRDRLRKSRMNDLRFILVGDSDA